MEEYREEVVTTTTTTEAAPRVPAAPITVNNPWQGTTERVEQVTVDPDADRRSALYALRQAIWLVFGMIEGLIAIRFILRLLGANPEAGFAQFIYGLTGLFIAPFVGLFPSPGFEGSVLEITSVVAMLVYLLLAWVIVKVALMFLSGTRTGVLSRRTDSRF